MPTIPIVGGGDTIVDDDDYPYISEFIWALTAGYPCTHVLRGRKWCALLLHRLVMGCTFGDPRIIDHINGNPLDNRKVNLRFCTHAQNMQNRNKVKLATSKYLGVHLDKRSGRWRACITVNRRKYRLGYFHCEEDAARAYDNAARKFHGEFARPNF